VRVPPRVPRVPAPFGLALFIAQLRVLFDLDDAMDGRPVASLESAASTELSRRGSDAPFRRVARPRAGGAKLGGGARPATCAEAYERGARGRELDQGGVASAPGGSSDEEPRRRRRRARWELLDRGVGARRFLRRGAAAAATTRAVGAAGGGARCGSFW